MKFLYFIYFDKIQIFQGLRYIRIRNLFSKLKINYIVVSNVEIFFKLFDVLRGKLLPFKKENSEIVFFL